MDLMHSRAAKTRGRTRAPASAPVVIAAMLIAAMLLAAVLLAPVPVALAQSVYATPGPTAAPEPAGRVGEMQTGVIGNCKEWVNLRDGPGKDYPIIGRIEKDAAIELSSWSRDGEWCEIFYANSTRLAWVSGEFVVR